MVIQAISKFGENIVKNNLTPKWVFQRRSIKVVFYINRESELVRWEELKDPIKKEIPIGVDEDCLSTARSKLADNLPYPLFDWMKNFQEQEIKEKYLAKMREYADAMGEPDINCICSFIENFEWEDFIKENAVNPNDYFYVLIEDQEEIDPFDNAETVDKTNHFIFGKIKEKKNTEIDTVGRKGEFIRKSSGLIQSGAGKARLISTKAYKECYYDDTPVCNISFLSEFYLFVGMEYLLIRNMYRCGTRGYALYSPETGMVLPLCFSVKNYCALFDLEEPNRESWNTIKEKIENNLKKQSLTYVEVDTASIGRISPFACYEYNRIETQVVIQNILTFIERTTDFADGKSLGDRVLYLIRENNQQRQDSFMVQCQYGQYIQHVLDGDYRAVIRDIITPRIINLTAAKLRNCKEYNDYIWWISNLIVTEETTNLPEKYREEEYLMGHLLAVCQILENRAGIQNEIAASEVFYREYLFNPCQTWNRIWARISSKAEMDKYQYKHICELVNTLNDVNWANNRKLETGKIIEGYCLTLKGYWKKLQLRKNIQDLLDYMLDGEIRFIHLPEEDAEEKIERRYKITIQEIKKEEKDE